MGEFDFKPTYEKDAGPIVRWIATKVLDLLHKIERPLYDYALMYEAVWEEDEEDFVTPHNQMALDWDEELGDELL